MSESQDMSDRSNMRIHHHASSFLEGRRRTSARTSSRSLTCFVLGLTALRSNIVQVSDAEDVVRRLRSQIISCSPFMASGVASQLRYTEMRIECRSLRRFSIVYRPGLAALAKAGTTGQAASTMTKYMHRVDD
ncbi:hypothetical protein BDV98DRAFT_575488 [Pterulicium gracile]|uniref:Uncharacterized protein n=1 Tax=Pterulicium gracile TaxID=1884261 RepID=A0A5C3Q9H7_9AGAR|nr:hypothetical protein BDV98DRAFT_575488 [Pterula gracilis]